MIIGKNLKKLLKNSSHRLAKEMLKLETDEANFVNDVDYAEIAIDNPSKISFVTKDRYNRILEAGPKKDAELKPGDIIRLTDYTFEVTSRTWFSRDTVVENKFIINKVDSPTFYTLESPEWTIMSSQIEDFDKIAVGGIPDPNNIWDAQLRQKLAYMTTPSRFLNKFSIECEKKELEEFNRLFLKDDICLRIEGFHFDLVSGDDIKWGYHEDNYYNSEGSLGSSCMRYEETQEYIQLYADYPRQISLLVLKNNDNKIRGRALVWKCYSDDEEITFMDRIYTDNSNFEEYFKMYAERRGWWYKDYQSRDNWKSFRCPDNYSIATEACIEITLKNAKGKLFPYTDTFIGGYSEDFDIILQNNSYGTYDFQSTEGGPFNEEEETVWSDYHGRDIPESEAVYSSHLETWIYGCGSVMMRNGSYMPEDHDDIVEINNYYYFRKDCIYSEYHDEYYLEDDVTYVEDEEDYYENDLCVYSYHLGRSILKENAVYSEYYSDWLLKEDCEEINNDWILEEDVEEYKVEMGLVEEEVE